MKKALFLSVFSLFCLVFWTEAWAWQRPMKCYPQVNNQGGSAQLNWMDERGGLHVGHLGSARGLWVPPACDRGFAESQWSGGSSQYFPGYNRPRHYPRYDRRYNNSGSDALAGVVVGAGIVILDRLLSQPSQPEVIVRERIIERPVYVEREATAPASIAPQAPSSPATETERYVHKTYRGYYETVPVRCSEEQLKRNKVQYGTSGWLQVPGDPDSRCYYNLQ